MNNDDHPAMRQIRVLGNRLDKIMIKYNEAVEMRKTYEVVHTKLSEERLGYEKQLQQIERSLKQKNSSMKELMRLSKQATLANEKASKDLQRAQKGAQPGNMPEIALSADLQYDLNDNNGTDT